MRSTHGCRLVWAALLLLAAVTNACKRETTRDAASPPAAAPPAAPAPGQASAPLIHAPPDLSNGDVSALLERWHIAQNTGDFSAYSALYSRAFHGVRRTAKAVARFDRAGWIKDRERMFKRPMSVEMRALSIGVKGPLGSVEFVQLWSSGSYSDEGTKRMVIRSESNGPRILSEELLDSYAVRGGAPAAVGSFVIVRVGDRSFAVLGGPLTDAADGEQTLAAYSRGDETLAIARALKEASRAKYAALEGAAVQLIANGKVCASALGAPAAYKFVVPPEDNATLTALRSGDLRPGAPLASTLQGSWELDAEVYAAAPVQADDCPDAVAAVQSPGVIVLTGEELKGALAEPLLASFDAQAPGRAFAQQYASYLREASEEAPPDPATLGHAHYADAASTLYRWSIGGSAKLATLTWSLGDCAYSADAFAATDLSGEAHWRDALRGIGPVVPLAVFDLEGDGQLEAVVESTWSLRRWLVRLSAFGQVLSSSTISIFRCTC